MISLQKLVAFFGRALFSVLFILSGFHKIIDWQGTQDIVSQMIIKLQLMYGHLSWAHDVLNGAFSSVSLVAAFVVFLEFVGGILLFFGTGVRLASLFLLLFVIPKTLLLCNFWDAQSVEKAQLMEMFLFHSSLVGALLVFLAYGNPLSKPAKKSASPKKQEDD